MTATGRRWGSLGRSEGRSVPGAIAVGVVATLMVVGGAIASVIGLGRVDDGVFFAGQVVLGALIGAALWAAVVVAVLTEAPFARSIATVALAGTVAQAALPSLLLVSDPRSETPVTFPFEELVPALLLGVPVVVVLVLLWYPWQDRSATDPHPTEAQEV